MMPPSYRTCGEAVNGERGVYLPIIAATLFAIITVLGWAIDSATLFVADLTTQRAADAAALAGAAKLALESPDYPNPPARVNPIDGDTETAAESIGRQNLILGGIRDGNITSVDADVLRSPAVAPSTRPRLTITVNIVVQAPLYVLRFVPGFGPTHTVRATSQSEVLPAIVSLILDRSGSMGCPNSNPSCTCAPNCPASPARRIDRLVDAVNNHFLTKFDQTRDMIGVTAFDKTAATLATANSAGGFNRATLTTVISGIAPSGPTNLCDGQFAGYWNTKPAFDANPDLVTAYVAFSDGASNAMRASFADPKRVLPNNNPTTHYSYDYYSWSAEWRIAGSGVVYPGVSRLAPAPQPPGGTVTCDDSGCSNSPACSTISFSNTGEDASTELGACLNTLKFRDLGGTIWPTSVTGIWYTDAPPSSYRYRFMDCAIPMTDWTRGGGNRGIWYTIGLGATNPTPSIDPYQNVNSDLVRKDNFLRRLAFDYTPTIPFPGFPDHADLLQDEEQTHGEYYPTPVDTDLPKIFEAIAQQIKIRLIR